MPYATNDKITRADMSNDPAWIEISEEQYSQALSGMQAGQIVSIDDGFALVNPPEPEELPNPEAPEFVKEISNAQGHAILILKNVYDSVIQYIGSIEDPIQKALAEVAFNRTQTWRMDSPFLLKAADDLGFRQDLDDWFVEAANIIL